jgi:hypothetical protein
LSNLLAIHKLEDGEKANSCSCKACGRVFQTSIQLTNLSATPMQIYNACPFCFAREENGACMHEENGNSIEFTSGDTPVISSENAKDAGLEHPGCPQHFGYLKSRPKNAPIPEVCLTCERMIKCVL